MSSEQPASSIVTVPSTQAPAPAQPSKVAILCEKRWHVFAYVFGFVAAFIALATVATVQINQYGSGATKGTIYDSAWKTNKVIWPDSQGGIPYPDAYSPGAKETNTSLALQLDLTFGNLVPASSGGTIDCRIHLELSNAYLNLATLPARPLYTLEMQLDGQKFTVSPTAQTVDWKVTMVLDSGNLLSFPFDKYSKSVTAIISLINSDGTVSLPSFYYKVDKTDAGFFSTTQGGSIDFTPYSLYTDPDDGSVTINFPSMKMTWQRPPFFRLYPMCLYIIFWIIMACEILYLIPFLMGSAKASFGNPGFYTSLLFAVPSMRNAMPGAPPIGSLADYYSFFWVMWVTVLMLLVSMHHFYMDNRKEQRPSGIPGETVLVGTWIAKNKKDPLPYRDNGMLDIPALIKFWKSTNAAEELF